MVNVKYVRSDGKEFIIDNTTWKILSEGLVGFDFASNELGVEANGLGDGAYITSKRYVEKDRTVTAVLVNKNLNNIMRQVVRGFFNARYTYKVFVTYGDSERWFEAELYNVSLPTTNVNGYMTLEVTTLSPTPFMYSIDDYAENIASVDALFEFPYNKEIGSTWSFGSFAFAQEVEIDNDGDVETFCKVVFTAKGEVLDPMIMKDDKYVRILDTMQTGDVIEVDLVSSPPKVLKNGDNIIRKVDRNSSFTEMAFQVGKNTIGFDASDGSNQLDVTVYFNKRYLGV